MAAIKSYTDIEQSKKLAEILPLETADMCWTNHCYGAIRSSMTISVKTVDKYKSLLDRFKDSSSIDVFYPAWSLAALLEVMPEIQGGKPIIALDDNYITYPHMRGLHTKAESLVDACVAMIEKLNEQNLL